MPPRPVVAVVAVITLGIALGLLLRAPLNSERAASESFDLETNGLESEGITGRQLGEPTPARLIGEPDSGAPAALAFANGEVARLAEEIVASAALANIELVAYNDLQQADEETKEVCLGVSRPTATEEILDSRAFRLSIEDSVADVRITEFSEKETVDRVLQTSRAAWESCDGAPTDFGGTVERSVLSFTSLSGTPGVNLRSTLLDESGITQSTSQTLAIPAGNVLIEIRIIANGTVESPIDPVAILHDLEALL